MKKLLSVLLALVMLVSVISVPAFAVDENTLSVVYHYIDPETKEYGPHSDRTEADGVAINTTFTVDFRAPNTNEKYFTGWYKNVECTGNPVTSIKVTNNGANHLYAGYKDFETSYDVNFADTLFDKTSTATGAYYPVKGGTFYRSDIRFINTGRVLKETEFRVQSNGTTHVLFTDEDKYIFQTRKGSSYKVSFDYKLGTTTDDLIKISIGMGKPLTQLKDTGAWQNSGTTFAITSVKENKCTNTDWDSIATVIDGSEFDDTNNLSVLGIRLTDFETGDNLWLRNIKVEELSVTYYAEDKIIKTTTGHTENEVVTPFVPTHSSGKTFLGWYLDEECKQPATTVTVTGAMKLYAKFGDPPKARYFVDGEAIKTEDVTIGEPYTYKSFIPENIPAGKYFTGWYTDAECTQLVEEAKLTETVEVTGDIARYTKLREYEGSFYPVPGNSGLADKMAMPYVFDRGEGVEDLYTPFLSAYSYDGFNKEEDYYKNTTGGSKVSFLVDENSVAYQVEPNATYKVTFKYKYTNTSTTDDEQMFVGVGFKGFSADNIISNTKRGFANITTAHSGFVSRKFADLTANTTAETEWLNAEFTFENVNLTGAVPVFGIGNSHMTGVTYKIKDLKVEKVVAKAYVHVGDEVTEKEVTPGVPFIPETPAAPEGKYFTGWYTNADLTGAIPEEGVVVEGDVHLYAGFETYKTVKYFVNGEVIKQVGNLKVGQNFTANHVPENIPQDKEFKGWYTDNGTFENKVGEFTITGDTDLYAKFVEPFGLTYVYKNKDGSEAKEVVEGVQVGDTYAIDFLAPNTNTQYFVGWYLDSNYSTAATKNVKLTNDEAYKLYAKYVDYSNVMNLHVPGDGDGTTRVYMPIILPTANATANYESRAGYYRWVASAAHCQIADFDAETGVTAIKMNPVQADAAHILVDENDQFVAAKPGKTYKLTAEVRSSRGNVKIRFGVGASRDKFQVYYNDNQWRRADHNNNGAHELIETSPATNVSAKDEFVKYNAVVTVPADYSDENYNFFALKIIEGGADEYVYVRSVTIEEYEISNTTGEYSEQIGGVVYEAGAVEDGETYAVTFDYAGEAANFGFFTADKDGEIYANVGEVDGDKVILSVDGNDRYTAYVTVDKAKGKGATLYAYAKDVTESTGVITEIEVAKLDNAITNEGASVLTPETEKAAGSQAIRYYFGYETDDGATIKINGNTFEVVKRGFLFANGTENGEERYDDDVCIDTTKVNVVNKFVSGAALANCWNEANGRITFSTHVTGFGEDSDVRRLFVKGYVTFRDLDGNEFTIYSEATNGTVAEIKAEYGQ